VNGEGAVGARVQASWAHEAPAATASTTATATARGLALQQAWLLCPCSIITQPHLHSSAGTGCRHVLREPCLLQLRLHSLPEFLLLLLPAAGGVNPHAPHPRHFTPRLPLPCRCGGRATSASTQASWRSTTGCPQSEGEERGQGEGLGWGGPLCHFVLRRCSQREGAAEG